VTPAPLRSGRVAEFDEAVGLGRVEEDVTGESFPFHCTQIADGSRSVAAGTPVVFVVVAARRGTWEAAAIRQPAG
jgi:cold shock CspA family protein